MKTQVSSCREASPLPSSLCPSDECSGLMKSQVSGRRLRKDRPLAAPVVQGDWKVASDDIAWKLQAKDVAAVAKDM